MLLMNILSIIITVAVLYIHILNFKISMILKTFWILSIYIYNTTICQFQLAYYVTMVDYVNPTCMGL